jgi:D-lactate dehydrogenase
MITLAFYDTKPYDKKYFEAASSPEVSIRFLDCRLNAGTASTAAEADAVCVFVSDNVNAACLQTLKKQGIRHIALRCAGYNNVDLKAARELGITVTRVPAYSTHAIAEHALALLLTLNRKIHKAYNRVREFNFSLNGLIGFDLHGKTAGIVGTGKIGKIAARILRGLGMKVLAYDPVEDAAWAKETGIEYCAFERLLRESDVVSMHLPLLPQTHHLFNEKTFSLMKQGAYLINTSRGKLVDTKALIEVLKSGKLGGVGLDVYEEEEGVFYEDLSGQVLKDDELSRLLTFPNVLITSHQAFLTHEGLSKIAQVTLENLSRLSQGKEFIDATTV